LSLDSNEGSNYQARELKTIHINRMGSFARLLIHKCHSNKLNLFNQVGLIAINLIGQDDNVQEDEGSSKAADENRLSDAKEVPNSLSDMSIDLNLDTQTASKLRSLAEAKARAITNEDYMTAKQIKLVEADLKEMGARLAQLDIAKRQAVKQEDYDRAANLKEQANELRDQIEEKVLL
jgi:centrosomal protein CEP104